jgi:hypothetical protein
VVVGNPVFSGAVPDESQTLWDCDEPANRGTDVPGGDRDQSGSPESAAALGVGHQPKTSRTWW